jgi:hypothetical protein
VLRVQLAYDLWHLAFANLMQHRAPPNFEVETEVRLTIEPQRADMLLLRRLDQAPARPRGEAVAGALAQARPRHRAI